MIENGTKHFPEAQDPECATNRISKTLRKNDRKSALKNAARLRSSSFLLRDGLLECYFRLAAAAAVYCGWMEQAATSNDQNYDCAETSERANIAKRIKSTTVAEVRLATSASQTIPMHACTLCLWKLEWKNTPEMPKN